MLNKKNAGLLIILSSPSGTGKTTITKRLVEENPELILSVSYTTRAPRKGEKEGRDYFFVSEEKFERMRAEGMFLEWAVVHGAFYGTPRDFVEKNLSYGKDIVLTVDVKGAKQVKEKYPDSVSIFILPPSIKELEKRLKDRETESEEEIEKRMEIASWEKKHADSYDYRVVNDKLENAVEKILSIIRTDRNNRR
jgi:guanylate kinase